MRVFILFLVSLCCSGQIFAQEAVDVDEKTHVEMILKSLSYDNKLTGGTVLVVSRRSSNQNLANVVKNLSGKTVKKYPIELFELAYNEEALNSLMANNIGINLIYLCNDLSSDQLAFISKICDQHKILSATGVSKFVMDGYACLSVINENNKPKLIFNMGKMKQEERQFSASYLKVCKLVETNN